MRPETVAVGMLVKINQLNKKPWDGPTFRVTRVGEIDRYKSWGFRVEGVIVKPNSYLLPAGAFIKAYTRDLERAEE